MNDNGFGRYLSTVRERDIDLLLMEEFHCSPEFVGWFCQGVGLNDVAFDGAWHSLSNVDGETDLLLCVRVNGQRIGVFIENKIGAPEQSAQDLRYHRRANRACEDGLIDDYETAMIAPAGYLAGLPGSSSYGHTISFEAIETWFRARDGRRAGWRAAILREAVEQNRRSNTMIENTTRSRFFLDYWEYLRRNHPSFVMPPPTAKGNKSRWVKYKGPGFGPGVLFTHKINQNVMELGFRGTPMQDLPDSLLQRVPPEALQLQLGKTAAFQLPVPALDPEIELSEQIDRVEAATQAAYRLLPIV